MIIIDSMQFKNVYGNAKELEEPKQLWKRKQKTWRLIRLNFKDVLWSYTKQECIIDIKIDKYINETG